MFRVGSPDIHLFLLWPVQNLFVMWWSLKAVLWINMIWTTVLCCHISWWSWSNHAFTDFSKNVLMKVCWMSLGIWASLKNNWVILNWAVRECVGGGWNLTQGKENASYKTKVRHMEEITREALCVACVVSANESTDVYEVLKQGQPSLKLQEGQTDYYNCALIYPLMLCFK